MKKNHSKQFDFGLGIQG